MFIWGDVSGEQDLGVVAERCPLCGTVAACRVTGLVQGIHVFFVPVMSGVTKTVCTCSSCGGHFAGNSGRYKTVVPAFDAITLTMEVLLERTNPALKVELAWSNMLEQFKSDPRFATALNTIGELPRTLGARLKADLQRWGGMSEIQRAQFVQEIDESARTLHFAKSIASQVPGPGSSGCLVGAAGCLAVCLASFMIPAVREGSFWWGVGVVIAGLLVAGAVFQFFMNRGVRRWIQDVLVPLGREEKVDFGRFIDLLDDLPPSGPRSNDAYSGLQEHAATIRDVLSEFGLLGSKQVADAL
jgi:hypothetical protein